MDDKHIENSLREAWNPQPPDGMRERIMRASRQELAGRQRGRSNILLVRMKFALAALVLLTILFTNISEYARQCRMSALVGGSPVKSINLRERNRMIGELMASSSSDDQQPGESLRKDEL